MRTAFLSLFAILTLNIASADSPPRPKFLFIGDSMSAGLHAGFVHGFKDRPFILENKGVLKRRFADEDTIDKMGEEVAEHRDASVVFVYMGGNDPTASLFFADKSKKRIAFSDSQKLWYAEYENRVKRMIELIKEKAPKAKVVWMGMPVVRKESSDEIFVEMNKIFQRQAEENKDKGVIYFSTREFTKPADPEKRYDAYQNLVLKPGEKPVARKIRYEDGTHFNELGNQYMARELLLPKLYETFPELDPKNAKKPAPSEEKKDAEVKKGG